MKILKASAGSGKTYNLARTYIKLLLTNDDRYAYRHILAVTFTNKATGEMKSRILSELHTLATNPRDSHYFDDFVPSLFSSAGALQKKSEGILTDILHDYSAFSVSTIDKFFQQALKAFSREIGQMASYQVELDKESLVHESVDRILDALTEDQKDVLAWLDDSVNEQLRKGERVNVEKNLYDIAVKLKSDEHRELVEKYGLDDGEMYSQERLEAVREECRAAVETFEEQVRSAAHEVCEVMDGAGVALSDTNAKFLTKVVEYEQLEPSAEIRPLTEAFVRKAMDSSQWFAKTRSAKYLPLVDGILQDPLERFCELFGTPYKVYCTAKVLYAHTFSLGIAGRLHKEFEDLMKEKNVISLDDSNSILSGIIDGSDAPFVYEKLGVRFEHFLLDEFQDTSVIQWDNFRPLLLESESSGRESLVVGDVKQSIYRWRGSDWHLLASQIKGQFPEAVEKALEKNFRSTRSVVEFNNAFFGYARDFLGVGEIYEDVEQEVATKDAQSGLVKVNFCDKDGQPELVLSSVQDALEAGALPSDIAVLVRNNSEGAEISQFLIANGIKVITDDSLDIKSSILLRRLVSLLSCVANPSDSISGYLASSLEMEFPEGCLSLPELCEHLLRSLIAADPACLEGQVLYVQSFMDMVQEWSAVNGHNILHFLKYWDEDCKTKISSPADSAAVRVITVHKSKGLEFPYVIFPYAEKVGLFRACDRWCKPSDDSDALRVSAQAIYPASMSSKAQNTLFADDYEEEKSMQIVDNLNIFYVALTRAGKCLHIIAQTPPDKFLNTLSDPADMSQVLYAFVNAPSSDILIRRTDEMEYQFGENYDFSGLEHKVSDEDSLPAGYPSYPLYGRLKVSADSADFFGEDGLAGVSASNRLNGIVLHDILSQVESVEDLRGAVDEAVRQGRITSDEGEADYALLRERLSSATERGWFGANVIEGSNEMSIIDIDGSLHRPDRVVCLPGRTFIIDYKFGGRKASYEHQVAGYADLYRRMGYPGVEGYLWYVNDDEVVRVDYQRP